MPLACAVALVGAALTGCQSGNGGGLKPAIGTRTRSYTDARAGPLTPQQLQASLMAFADRFIARIEEATDDIESQTTDPQIRMQAHAAKYYPTLSIVTSAADPDPEAALLDIVTTVTLERSVWGDGIADRTFGKAAKDLMAAFDEMSADIWAIAAKVLSAEQLASLQQLIDAWRTEHPDQTYVSTVRFDDFMFLRDSHLRQSTSLIKLNLVVASADEAVMQMAEARFFAERALFLAGRMPLLISWQAELLAYDLALAPEVTQSLTSIQNTSAAIAQLSDDLHALPDRLNQQLQQSMDMLDQRQAKFSELVGEVRASMADAQQLTDRVDVVAKDLTAVAAETTQAATALDGMMQSADRLVARFEPASGPASQPGVEERPFDIREYTQALSELTIAAKELNALMQQTDVTLQSPQWQSRVQELNLATKDRIDQLDAMGQNWLDQLDVRAQRMWDRFLYRGILIIIVGAALFTVGGLLIRRFSRAK